MFEPTGSVYLDTPRPRPTPPPRPARGRVVFAGVLGFVGITSMALAGLLTGIHFLVADPDPMLDAINGTLDSPVARAEMHRELSAIITERMVGPEMAEAVVFYGIDVAAEADSVTVAVLADPAFRSELDRFAVAAHHLMLVDPDGPPVDASAVTDAAMVVIQRRSPTLAGLIDPDTEIIAFDATSLPDLSAPMRFVDQALMIAVVAMLGVPLAAAIHPRRHRVLAWVGRLWLVAGGATAAATVGLPYLGGRISGWSTVEVAIRGALLRFLVPAAAVALIGLVLMNIAAMLRRRESTRISREGAGAALGMGLIPAPAPTHGLIDLAARGLVDAGRPLTNI